MMATLVIVFIEYDTARFKNNPYFTVLRRHSYNNEPFQRAILDHSKLNHYNIIFNAYL